MQLQPPPPRRAWDRRAFLSLTGTALGAAPFLALGSRAGAIGREPAANRRQPTPAAGYGPLAPVNDETTGLPLLQLPAGFRYLSFGWTGDPLVNGIATPGAHDGMAAFAASGSRVRLVRNHEIRDGGTPFTDGPVYDPNAGGGTTTIEFDTAAGTVLEAWASLSGTAVNCAGGPTPWGSWLTCEETLLGPGGESAYQQPHGYIFEVPAEVEASGEASGEPLRAMGRFVHEAVAVDPDTGIVYETEDRGESGLYRFLPAEPGNLAAGGRLEMLALADDPWADLRTRQTAHVWRPVAWVPIDQPDPVDIWVPRVYTQGAIRGGATFARLEGAWYGDGRIYIVSTTGGDADAGQVWEYDPAGERLRLIFESPGVDVLDMPDNLCVSPRGGLVLCEDGLNENFNFLRGLTVEGEIFPFAKNDIVLAGEKNGISGNFRHREFAGATYSPDGRWLFVNAQSPGITFAVTGPWADGPL